MPDFKDVHYDYTLLRNKYIDSGIVGSFKPEPTPEARTPEARTPEARTPEAPPEEPTPGPSGGPTPGPSGGPTPEPTPEPEPTPALEGAREGARGGAREGPARGGPAVEGSTEHFCTKFGILKTTTSQLKMFSRFKQDELKTFKYNNKKGQVQAGAYCVHNWGVDTVTNFYLAEKYSWLDIIRHTDELGRELPGGAREKQPDFITYLVRGEELKSDYHYFIVLIEKFFKQEMSDDGLIHFGNEELFRYIEYILGLNLQDALEFFQHRTIIIF